MKSVAKIVLSISLSCALITNGMMRRVGSGVRSFLNTLPKADGSIVQSQLCVPTVSTLMVHCGGKGKHGRIWPAVVAGMATAAAMLARKSHADEYNEPGLLHGLILGGGFFIAGACLSSISEAKRRNFISKLEDCSLSVDEAVTLLRDNFEYVMKEKEIESLIFGLIEQDELYAQALSPFFEAHFLGLIQDSAGASTLFTFLQTYPTASARIFIPLIEKHFENMPRLHLYMLMHLLPCELKARLIDCAHRAPHDQSEIVLQYPFIDVCMGRKCAAQNGHESCMNYHAALSPKDAAFPSSDKVFTDEVSHHQICMIERNSATDQHLKRYQTRIASCMAPCFDSKQFSAMLEVAFQKEVQLESQGYVVFKHGQRWDYAILERWFTQLWGCIHGQDVSDYLFLHLQPLDKDQIEEQSLRQRIIHDGVDNESRLLYMNYPLYGNAFYMPCCSVYYAFKNFNQSEVRISMADVFAKLGFEEVYASYQADIEQLEQEYRSLSKKHGALVLIAVPEVIVSDCVYMSMAGGARVSINIERLGLTDHVPTILQRLRHDPGKIKTTGQYRVGEDVTPFWTPFPDSETTGADLCEFVLVMTQDEHGGMNPKSGIKMFQLHAADCEAYAAFAKKEAALLKRIKAEILGDKAEAVEEVVRQANSEPQGLLGAAQRRLFEELSLE